MKQILSKYEIMYDYKLCLNMIVINVSGGNHFYKYIIILAFPYFLYFMNMDFL